MFVARIKGEKRKEIVILNTKIGPWFFFTWNQEAALKFHLKMTLSGVIVFCSTFVYIFVFWKELEISCTNEWTELLVRSRFHHIFL